MPRPCIRAALIVLCVAVATPLVLIGAYDAFVFQPRRAEIAAVLARATPDELSLSPYLRQLIKIDTHDRTTSLAARQLLVELHVPRGMLGWHVTNALWTCLVALHVPDADQVRIFVSTAYLGNERGGFSAGADAAFHRPLSTLALTELATLVTISRSPSMYRPETERLSEARDRLLTKFYSSTQ